MPLNQFVEEVILDRINQSRMYHKSFEDIISNYENKLLTFDPINSSFKLEPYFGKGKREGLAKKLLLDDGRIKKDWLRIYSTKNGNKKTDFKGLYIFIIDLTPFYVGISKGVVGRICQHLKGRSHNTSTLAYKIGLLQYEYLTGKYYKGQRMDFDFERYVEPAKNFLMKQKIAFMPIENDEELFLFEVFCSMKLKTCFNDFETH